LGTTGLSDIQLVGVICVHSAKSGAQPGGGAFGAFASPEIFKTLHAILTFVETFKE